MDTITKPVNYPIRTDINRPLELSQVIDILTSDETPSTQVPFRPKAGDVYFYKPGGKIRKDDWRADGYR